MRPHAKLRGAMMAADIDSRYLARKILRGQTYVSHCMMGHQPWTVEECYKILDLIHAPYSEFAEYFPPKGIPTKEGRSRA